MQDLNQDALKRKESALYARIDGFGSLAVAFSGGIDSTLLLAAAERRLGDRVVAFTAVSEIRSGDERENALDVASALGVRHILVETDELGDPEFVANPVDRCYYCKRKLFAAVQDQARKLGLGFVAHGANLDDLSDVRPGFRAARELSVEAPLVDVGMTKADIRQLARQWGLPNWDRPAMACLATRIPYGTEIRVQALRRIERAEAMIRALGIDDCRVRHYGNMARIELDGQMIERVAGSSIRRKIVAGLRTLGYAHICLDLEGYVSGKMNHGIETLRS